MSAKKPIGPGPNDIYRDIHLPLKTIKRCRKHRWVHYHQMGAGVKASSLSASTICGKTNYFRPHEGPSITNQLSAITCPRCIDVLKRDRWYCPTHGFIDDKNVTFEETCEICGNGVLASPQ